MDLTPRLQTVTRIAPPAAPAAAARTTPAPAPARPPVPGSAVPGEFIVGFRPGVTLDEQAALLKSLAPRETEQLPLINGVLIRTDPMQPTRLAGLAADVRSKILFSQPNFRQGLRGGEGVAVPVATPAVADASAGEGELDPNLAQQYHLENTGQTGGTAGADVKATKAWKDARGAGVVIALCDTNIDITHEDVAGNIWTNPGEVAGNGKDDDGNGFVDDVNGWNFGKDSNRPQDGGQTHGTHVAGIIAGVQGNGRGGSGVAPDAKIMPLAILTSSATTANAIKAFDYAVRNGADVISNSWGNNTYEPALAEAVRQAVAAGTSVVVAAGNENWDTGVNGSYPDNYAGSLSVAASDDKDAKASYSNRGTLTIDVAAPGDNILSSLPGNRYGTMSGTSMAAPVVSGLLALVKSRFPELTMKEVEARVMRSVQRDGAAKAWNSLVASGGRVDAAAAMTPLAAVGAPVATDGAVVGTPVRLDWKADITHGQRFHVEASTNADARSAVAEDFESGRASRAFATAGDKPWAIGSGAAKSGSNAFQVDGLGRGQQSRLELTETITEPTEVSFDYRGGKGGELSFFINRDLQFQPTTSEGYQRFTAKLQPGTYTFSWLATAKSGQSSPVAIDGLRIGSVSDAVWAPIGSADAATGLTWTPDRTTAAAAVRVRPDNGAFQGDWVTSDQFEVVAKQGG